MKLWEAMLAGAKAGAQLFGRRHDDHGGSCALGAIEIASGDGKMAESSFKELDGKHVTCIECGRDLLACSGISSYTRTLAGQVAHLNNDHRWSWQRIAEWLANRELKFKPIQEVQDGSYIERSTATVC